MAIENSWSEQRAEAKAERMRRLKARYGKTEAWRRMLDSGKHRNLRVIYSRDSLKAPSEGRDAGR